MVHAAQASRASLESEPDLVAFDSSSILPGGGAGYSYGPSTSPMSRRSSDNVNIDIPDSSARAEATVPATASHTLSSPASTSSNTPSYLNRSRARASSMASKLSGSTLPLYTERDAPTASASSSSSTPAPGPLRREHSGAYRRSTSDHSDSDSGNDFGDDYDDEDDEDDEDDDENSLEMDTLNKNSGGKGGWKMVANTDKYGNTPTSATFPSGSSIMAAGSSSRLSLAVEGDHSGEKVHKQHATASGKKGQQSRFEPFDKIEWSAMITSLVLVSILTVLSLQICFAG